MNDYNWSPDGSKLALASVSRDHKHVWLRVADTTTGAVRTAFEEVVPTQFESRTGWRVLWPTNEVIWHSERDNWGQLYLYDLQTGKLKNRSPRGGPGDADRARRRETRARSGSARTDGRRDRTRTSCTSIAHVARRQGHVRCSLTPDDGTHTIQFSPSGKYLVDTYSKPDAPPSWYCATPNGPSACRSRRPTSRSCSRPAGSRRCRSR
jgi:dipeptidyl aminopeptidase/acylaminoacyl peptidase